MQTESVLGINDYWMFVKAGDAMRGSARRFCHNWKPRVKTWENITKSIQFAFPDGFTWCQRLEHADEFTSDTYKSLRKYGVDNSGVLPLIISCPG